MERLVVEITDESKISFVKELLGSFNFLKVKEECHFTPAERRLVEKFSEAFEEVEAHVNGNTKLKSAREFLSEL
jgi:hypothetical protein